MVWGGGESARGLSRWLLTVAAVAVGVASWSAGPAVAANVSLDQFGHGRYDAAPGEVNDVRVTIDRLGDGAALTFVDLGAVIVPGRNCAAPSPHEAVCAVAAVAWGSPFEPSAVFTISAGDADDRVSLRRDFGGDPYIVLDGGPGADTLAGSVGLDTLVGGPGDDTLRGGAGQTLGHATRPFGDFLDGGPGHDVLLGGAGRDTLAGGPGADTLSGGSGADEVTYWPRRAGVTADLDGRADDGRTGERDRILTDVEELVGSSGADVLRGNGKRNWLNGLAGNDRILGLGGGDVLVGEGGSDVVRGGPGDDWLSGYPWFIPRPLRDWSAEREPAPGRDRLLGGLGNDRIAGADGREDRVDGGAGSDRATFDSELDRVLRVERRVVPAD
jgi:RTX calcium-binding nonapeptide repeat (4 copies)